MLTSTPYSNTKPSSRSFLDLIVSKIPTCVVDGVNPSPTSVRTISSRVLFSPKKLIDHHFSKELLFAFTSPFQYSCHCAVSFGSSLCSKKLSYNLNSDPFLVKNCPCVALVALNPDTERVEPANGLPSDDNSPAINVELKFNITCFPKSIDSPVVFTNVVFSGSDVLPTSNLLNNA